MSELKRLEVKIRAKTRRHQEVSDLAVRLEDVIAIQKSIGQAFRETIERIQRDFKALKARVEIIEKKLEGKLEETDKS